MSSDTVASANPSIAPVKKVERRPELPYPDGKSRRLGGMLLQKGFITAEQLDEGLAIQKDEPGYLGHILVELGHIDQVLLYSSSPSSRGCRSYSWSPRTRTLLSRVYCPSG